MKPTKNNPMKGTTFDKRKGKWVARPSINRKPVFLGYFTTQEEAYEALCKLKIEIEKEVV